MKATKTKPSEPSGAPETTPEKPKRAPRARKAQGEAKESRVKKPAGPAARALREKLQELADRGVNGERDAAILKLARLEARYDFSAKVLATADIFRGPFQGSSNAEPVGRFKPQDWDVGNSVKAGIEKAAGIPCVWRNEELLAKADSISARKLASIAGKVSQAFVTLWSQFASTPGVHPADRRLFVAGLGDGMIGEVCTGKALPSRPARSLAGRKAKAKALAAPRGLVTHPYSIGAALGERIRFDCPLDALAGELENAVTKQIE